MDTLLFKITIEKLAAQLEKLDVALAKLQKRNDPDCHMNAKEAAAYVGVSVRHFHEQVRLGKFRPIKVGRRKVFRRSDLDADLDIFKAPSHYRRGKRGGAAA
jgi:excisionase family DNA binding protein